MKGSVLMVICLLGTALTSNEAKVLDVSSISSTDLDTMKEVFFRSQEARAVSMASMMKTMSVTEAVDILQKKNLTTPALMQINNMALRHQGNLRTSPQGYAGLDSARRLLNDMIYKAMDKYEDEIDSCTDYYSEQCAALGKARSDIAGSNYIAASSRYLITVAKATIRRCNEDITAREITLNKHNTQCTNQLSALDRRLKIVMGDIKVLTTILQMTKCKTTTGLLQLRRCKNECTNKSLIEFSHHALQEKVNKLQSELSRNIFQDTMADLFDGIESLQSTELVQTGGARQTPIDPNTTKSLKPPVPMSQKVGPCSDPYKGGPPPISKRDRNQNCIIVPQECFILQGRFLRIQAGVVDEKEELEERAKAWKEYCEETRSTLAQQIADCEYAIDEAGSDMSDAMKKEAIASKHADTVSSLYAQLNNDLEKKMKVCRANYAKLQGEECALKKIRGELYKMKGDGHTGLFKDCVMGAWAPEECSKECGGGERIFNRGIASAEEGGAKCLPEMAKKSCNDQPCPVDCEQEQWSGWSKCSAECGGGVEQRLRRVEKAMKYGGKPCGVTSQTTDCNTQACEVDCILSDWTKWSSCSKDCDGGTKKRVRFVLKAATGAGECADEWATERLEYTDCAMKSCTPPANRTTLTCFDKQLDVVLLLDGSGSMTQAGFDAEIQLANKFALAFIDGTSNKARMSVILYSGPRDWNEWRQCFGRYTTKETRQKACSINTVTHLSDDISSVPANITKLTWPQGGTLTSLALRAAQAELGLGRKNTRANVVVFTDGRPTSPRWTQNAARSLRKAARLLWVPVTQYAPLSDIKKWATRRWEENVFKVNTFDDLKKTADHIVTHIIASICPTGRLFD